MRRSKPPPTRNKLDLADPTQVRLVRKRLHLSDSELTAIVGRIGNSIAAIGKEAALQRANRSPQPADAAPDAVIASTVVTDQPANELTRACPRHSESLIAGTFLTMAASSVGRSVTAAQLHVR